MHTSKIGYLLSYKSPKEKYEGYFETLSCSICHAKRTVRLGKEYKENYNSRFQDSKIPRFQDSKIPRFQDSSAIVVNK